MMPTSSFQPEALEELRAQLADVRHRLLALEQKVGGVLPLTASQPETAAAAIEIPLASEPAPAADNLLSGTARLPTLIGQSLLGLALAYLLRAFTENQTLPVTLGITLGTVYALVWLLWAARTPAAETLTVGLRSLTSVLIIVPLLWEAHVRFLAISAWPTAAILVFFSVAGLVISWKKSLTAVAWISSIAAMLACVALVIKTQEVVPYTVALLVLALAVEASACLDHYLGERWIVALAADFAVLLVTFLATRPAQSVPGYAPMDLATVLVIQISLVAIYFASTFVRTLWRGFRITPFEIAQSSAALAISATGAVRVSQGNPAAVLAVGIFCLLCGIICYTISFAFLERHAGSNRNFQTYALFGLAMVFAGSALLLSGGPLAALWCLVAVLFVVGGRNAGRLTLKFQAAVYLGLATVVSGAAPAFFNRFLTTSLHRPEVQQFAFPALISAAAAIAAYFVVARAIPRPETASRDRAVCVLLAGLAAVNVTGVLAMTQMELCRRLAGDFCSAELTAILVAAGIAGAYFGVRLNRPEWKWISAGIMAVATLKIIGQDLREGHAFAVVLSLLLYGGALLALPKLMRTPIAPPKHASEAH